MQPVSLSADDRSAFLTDGYLTLQPTSLDEADHRHLYDRAGELYAEAAATASPTAHLEILGDNLRARIPALQQLLDDPVVAGALTSLLGPGYVIHPHSYCHRSEHDQLFHQDGNLPWNERGHYRSHRPDWALVFYYPQAVDLTNGPTEVIAGSQYWTVDHERSDGSWHRGDRIDRSVDAGWFADPSSSPEQRDQAQRDALANGLGLVDPDRRFVTVPAGSVLVAHYDIVHRGSRTAGHPDPRYLYKFCAARVSEPRPVSTPTPVPATAEPAMATTAAWLDGAGLDGTGLNGTGLDGTGLGSPDDELETLVVELNGDAERDRVAAAYRLGLAARQGDEQALDRLGTALLAQAEGVRRAAGIGLRQAGRPATTVLLDGLTHAAATTRRPAVAALGGEAGVDDAAVDALIGLVAADPDDLVRSNAAYSLGLIARFGGTDPAPICDALLDRLAPGAEADNAFGAGFARSTVRQSAAFALLLVAANHPLPADRMARIIDGPLRDDDRYVQGLVAEAVARMGPLPADLQRTALQRLAATRWNPPPRPVPAAS